MAVSPTEMIGLKELKDRFGLGTHAVRTARRNGLKVRKIGRNKFVLGEDLIAFLREQQAT